MGFRNVLVHDYVDVDDGIVLERLADLDDFVAVVAAWVVPPRS
ncbi:MAG: HepT-like ribonuclease domain-containing protein [Pseudonocardiaceae bacterium]